MRTLKLHFPAQALPTWETFLKQTKEARIFRRAQAVREVVQGHRLQTVSGLDHGVGHFQLPSLRHGSLRWPERGWRDVDRFHNRGQHRPRFLTEAALRRRRPVRPCEETVMQRRQTGPLSGMVQAAQLMVPQ